MLRACVIGMGPIGNRHARIYQEDPLAELVGVCDILKDRAASAALRLSVPVFYDAQKLLNELKPDVVSITTGGHEYGSDHFEPTMQALDAGCHVLGEKPISNEIDMAEQMVARAREKRRCYGINLNHRFTPAAHHFIGLMDGQRSVQQIWEATAAHLGDAAPTQEEAIRLLGQLHAADALLCDVPPDSLEVFRRFQRHERMAWRRRLWPPLALRFPLLDPDRFLDQSHPTWAGHWNEYPRSWQRIPDERLVSKEAREVVDAAIATLPESQRTVITLRDVDGFGSEEVCELLGLSEGNQRVLLHRARSRVRRALEEYFEDDEL